ncbi:MAG: ABC transporter ATP-binding protein [Sphaerochaetaceae bacterium]|nr:ABC transporter ATP-binding protein [Sphaerochaetaceae bacterium]
MEHERTLGDGEDLVIEMRKISKQFSGVLANDEVDFTLKRGEIHALLGENGAGKSTLMNILYGLYSSDGGEILLNGEKKEFSSPNQAIQNRIGMIHQHFMLIPTLTVVENVALGLKDQRFYRLNLKKVEKRIMELSELYGLAINPWARVGELSVGEQQRVEILKVLYRDAQVLIMDEPTAVLTPNEVTELFIVLRDITKRGNSIIFISHKLWEVMEISDRVTVLRDGRRIETVETSLTTREKLAEMMVGREVILQYDHPPVRVGAPILQLEDVHCADDKGLEVLRSLSFSVCAGEVVGIAGVDGNGQKELAEVVHGLRHVDFGKIFFNREEITNKKPRQIIARGLAHIPEDRHSTAIVMDFSVTENLTLMNFDSPPFTTYGMRHSRVCTEYAQRMSDLYDIRGGGVTEEIRNLSGGNQQKVVIARELDRNPDLLIAAQPSRGLDIGATEFIQKQLIAERTKGKAVLLISTDLDEVLAVSDRVLIIYKGEIMKEIIPSQASFEEIGLAMAGVRD